MPLTPAERSLRARLAAHRMHAAGKTSTEAARRAFEDKFVNEVDPLRVLPPEVRARRALHAKAAHMAALSLVSSVKRRQATAATPL